jgi:hypothetical protein
MTTQESDDGDSCQYPIVVAFVPVIRPRRP